VTSFSPIDLRIAGFSRALPLRSQENYSSTHHSSRRSFWGRTASTRMHLRRGRIKTGPLTRTTAGSLIEVAVWLNCEMGLSLPGLTQPPHMAQHPDPVSRPSAPFVSGKHACPFLLHCAILPRACALLHD
jgi:hypothetical protein